MEPFRLPTDLAGALCDHLGVALPTGPRDLAPLYRAWCATVPFDNVAKGLALAEDRTPPGADPVAFVEEHLATGLGGTCWGHVATLVGLLGTAGVEATVGLDRYVGREQLVDFHAFVAVRDGGEIWALDPVHVSGDPLPLRPGARGGHPAIDVGIEGDADRLLLSVRYDGDPFRYAILSTVLDRADVRAFCAVSATHTGVPTGRLSARRALLDATVGLHVRRADEDGPETLVVRRREASGPTETPYDDPDEAFAVLGYTPEARRRAERAGLLPLPRAVTR